MVSKSPILQLPVLETEAFHRRFEEDLRAADTLTTLQVNIGYVCNLACKHCHVESSPARTKPEENMSAQTVAKVLQWLDENPSIRNIDITGGSPEMNPNFQHFVRELRSRGISVIDRCNPTIIEYVERRTGRDFKWVPAFLAEQHVQVVASLPCYSADNVDRQRGRGSYDASIEGLLKLNDVGYGTDPNLKLNLVFNPNGPSLPPPQEALQADYQRELMAHFGIRFNQLWTITNMPIKRWRYELEKQNKLPDYMQLLIDNFNPCSIEGLMCRHQVSIDPQGRMYDCDFNQALNLGTLDQEAKPIPTDELLFDYSVQALANRPIATADHCYACTAGSGSSCGGALV